MSEYALWHGSMPMHRLWNRVTPERLLVEGYGIRVKDAAGHWFIDVRAGIANLIFGYRYRPLVNAISEQLETLVFAPTIRYTRPAKVTIDFAERLASSAPQGLNHVRLYNVGSLATEAATSIARMYQVSQGRTQRTRILSLPNSYHGSTLATFALSGQTDLHGTLPVEFPANPPMPSPIEMDPDKAIQALRQLLDELDDTVAGVIVEPILGNGMFPLPKEYLQDLRSLCDQRDLVLTFDEVVTGFGRTGELFAAQYYGVIPDLMTLAKGITGGYIPMAALLTSDRIFNQLNDPQWFFPNGYSTDGHAVASRAGMVVLQELTENGMLQRGRDIGEYMNQQLRSRLLDLSIVTRVQGIGTLAGISLGDATIAVRARDAIERRGVLVHCFYSELALTPPYVMTTEDCDEMVDTIVGGIQDAAEGER